VNRIYSHENSQVLPSRPSDKVTLDLWLNFGKDGERGLFERAAESRHSALSWIYNDLFRELHYDGILTTSGWLHLGEKFGVNFKKTV
jgi:hypothetical protein